MHSYLAVGAGNAAIPALKVVRPSNEKRTVGRKTNAQYRSRGRLTEREMERLIEAAKDNRYGHRDATMVLLRTGTACGLQNWLTSLGADGPEWRPSCTSVESNRVVLRRILSPGWSYAPCGGWNGTRRSNRHSSS